MSVTKQERKSLSSWAQFVDLFLMELAQWRQSWRTMLVSGIIASLVLLISLGIFARDDGPKALHYVFTGNVVASLLFGTTTAVQNRFIHMRVSGLLDYYATLPIRLFELILAIVIASLLFSLPAVSTVILLGSRILSVTLNPSPLIWIVIPLSTLPFAGIGALAGTTMKTIEESSTVTRIIMLGLTILGPVISPPYLLPEVVLILGRFNPASYTASALRQVLVGPITTQLGLDLMAMIGFSVLSFWNVGRRIDWRRQL